MTARTLPNLGLRAFYELGEDNWKDDQDLGLLKLSVLVQGRALDKVDEEPASPDLGDVYILDETHATHPNEIAIWDGETGEEAWVYVTPNGGWLIYNVAANNYEKFDSVADEWAPLPLEGVTDAPLDGENYVRRDGAWEIMPPPAPSEVISVVGSTYDLLADDQGKYIRFTGGSAKTVTVQDDATEALPDNGEWHIRNANEGDLTIEGDVGVTINPPNGGTLVVPEGGTVTIKRVAEDEFDLLGQTVAA